MTDLKNFKPTKMIYLASPYSHENKKVMVQRYKQITKIAAQLEEEYPYSFILPITMSHNTAKYTTKFGSGFEDWRLRDLTYISRCDELWVVLLKGWNVSVGVREEIDYAKAIGIPVKYLSKQLGKWTYVDPRYETSSS